MLQLVRNINTANGVWRGGEEKLNSVIDYFTSTIGGDSATSPRNAYAKNVWAYRSINYIAQNIAKLPFKFYQINANGDKTDISHLPEFGVFYKPNPFQTSYDFILESFIRVLEQGELFWQLAGNGNRVQQLYADWRSSQVRIIGHPTKRIDHYEVTVNSQTSSYSPDEVFFRPLFQPYGGLRGLSPLQVAKDNLQLSGDTTGFYKKLFQQGMRLSGYITMPAGISEVDAKRWSEGFRQTYEGRDNMGKTGVLPDGSKWEPMNQGQANSTQYTDLNQMSREDICAVFGLSIEVFGLGNTTHANKEEARQEAWNDTLLPMLCWLVGGVNRFLVPRITPKENVILEADLSAVEVLQEDREAKANTYATGFEKGAVTPNEIRRDVFGYDPLQSPEMDQTYIAFNVAPMVGDHGSNDPGETLRAIASPGGITKALDYDQRTRIWREKISRIETHERSMERQMQLFFGRQGLAISEAIRGQGQVNRSKDPAEPFRSTDIFDIDFWVGELSKVAEPILIDAFLAAAEEWVEGAFDLADPVAQAEIGRRVTEMSRFINETTAERIQRQLQEGFNAGEDVQQLADRIFSKIFDPSITAPRSRLIARTETVGASNAGTQKGLERGGWPSKLWITSRDDNVREDHLIDGQIVSVDDVFRLANGEVRDYPNDPNERCIHIGSRVVTT